MSKKVSKHADTTKDANLGETQWFCPKGIKYVFDELIPEAADVLKSDNKSPVMVTGPTGVGKTHITWKIIKGANIPEDKVKRVNCASFTPELADSEFFGHEKGAFTGATKPRKGLLDDSKHDLIVFEELGTLPTYIQAKLLVYLETGEIRRLGKDENQLATANVKIMGVTNSRPDSTVFREDFLYRFYVIAIPGLHQRRHDIPQLLQHFVPRFRWSRLDVLRLMCYNWPGNMRQFLRFTNLVKRYKSKVKKLDSVLEWFDQRFIRILDTIPRGPGTPGVPHMKGLQELKDWYLSDATNIWRQIGTKLPHFSLFSENDEVIYRPQFKYKDLEKDWDEWCLIVGQDKFADKDLWECLIRRERTAFADPREGAHGDPDGLEDEDVLDLAEAFSTEWYPTPEPSSQQRCQLAHRNSFLETLQQKKQEITPEEALQIVFREYPPPEYKRLWLEHNAGMPAAIVAPKLGLKPASVTRARKREEQKESKPPKKQKGL